MLINVGRLDEAEAGLREALPMLREALPQNHPTIASALNGLGGVLRRLERYAESEAAYREALAIRLATYGEEHPAVATTISNLAWLRQAQADLAGAIELHEEALQIRRRILPSDHPDIAHSLAGLARVQLDEGRIAEAREATLEALSIRRATLGERSWITLRTMLMAAEALRRLENYQKAGALLDEARAIAIRYPEDFSDDQRRAIARQRAMLFDAMGKEAEAAELRAENGIDPFAEESSAAE